MRVSRLVVPLSLLLLTAAPAFGDDVADAQKKFRAGAAAYREARYKEAIDLFLQANQLDPHPELIFNVGQAFEKLGNVPDALRAYRDYLRLAPDAEDKATVVKSIKNLEQRLRERGLQQVSVFSKPPGARVFLDEAEVGSTPLTFETKPGRHVVVLKSSGLPDATKEFLLLDDRSMDIDVTLGGPRRDVDPAPTASASASAAEASAPVGTGAPKVEPTFGIGMVKPWTWAAFGVGVLGLGVAAGLEGARAGAESAAEDDPTQVGASQKYDAMLSQQMGARVMVGIGAAGLAAGALLLVLDVRSGRVAPAPAAGTVARPAVSLGCGVTGCGMSVSGGF